MSAEMCYTNELIIGSSNLLVEIGACFVSLKDELPHESFSDILECSYLDISSAIENRSQRILKTLLKVLVMEMT